MDITDIAKHARQLEAKCEQLEMALIRVCKIAEGKDGFSTYVDYIEIMQNFGAPESTIRRAKE